MSSISDSLLQKEYLKKYLSQDNKDTRKKKRKKTSATASNLKRSQIIDDDIDLKSMRPLDDDEVELYHMDEDAPQIAGIIDERPDDIKAQEYYNSKRWKVFGGEDGVNVLDSMDKNQQSVSDKLSVMSKEFDKGSQKRGHVERSDENAKKDWDTLSERNIENNLKLSSNKNSTSRKYVDLDESPRHQKKPQSSRQDDSDLSPLRTNRKGSAHGNFDSDTSSQSKNLVKKYDKRDRSSDSDASQPKRDSRKDIPKRSDKLPPGRDQKRTRQESDSDPSPPRKTQQKRYYKNGSDSDASPPRRDSRKDISKRTNRSPPNRDQKRTSDNAPPRRDVGKRTKYKSDSDNSPSRKEKISYKKYKSDSDPSPPRKAKESKKKFYAMNTYPRSRRKSSSGSDSSPRRDRRNPPFQKNYSPQNVKRKHSSRSITPPIRLDKPLPLKIAKSSKNLSPRLSRRDLMNEKNVRRRFSDSDDSPPRRRSNSFRLDESTLDDSPSRKKTVLKKEKPLKKALYKPNESSSSDESSRSRSKKMKITLDGKQAGLQDAKQLRKELSDLRMKEDAMFSKMDASVSGAGAAPIKRDRKTGKIRDLEKEKEEQKEKEAKASVVNEKYYKWGKGLKQVEDAAERVADAIKEMNKPLARYKDDEDLDNFLKAQEREGDPMLDYIKQKQKEATPLAGTKPLYQGSFNPNRFGIRPGHRWDGVVRSNGYEKEWFTHKNARKARDEEAYKWSTSDM